MLYRKFSVQTREKCRVLYATYLAEVDVTCSNFQIWNSYQLSIVARIFLVRSYLNEHATQFVPNTRMIEIHSYHDTRHQILLPVQGTCE